MKIKCQKYDELKLQYKSYGLFTMIFLLLCVLVLPVVVYASGIQSSESIRHAVDVFLSQQFPDRQSFRYQVSQLDKRLRLASCRTPLQAYLPENARLLGHTSIGVQCHDKPGWKIYVGVQVSQFKNVLVTRRNLPRGHMLIAADVMKRTMDISTLSQGFYDNFAQLEGMVVARSLLRDQPLHPGMITRPMLVKRGQIVTILAKTGQISVRVKGKAMMDGKQGELVKVRNLSTNRELRGIVVSQGVVKVTL